MLQNYSLVKLQQKLIVIKKKKSKKIFLKQCLNDFMIYYIAVISSHILRNAYVLIKIITFIKLNK